MATSGLINIGDGTNTPPTQTGTPLVVGSTRSYVLQWNGTQIVSALARETGSNVNGNYDIDHLSGTMKQWGTLLFATSGTAIALPAAFANTNYTVVVSSAAGVNIFVTTGTKTTSNFICITLTNVGSPSNNNPISYYAIGQKP